jgi:hypothetical protein
LMFRSHITYDRIFMAFPKYQYEANEPGRQTKLLWNRVSFKTGHFLVVWDASH